MSATARYRVTYAATLWSGGPQVKIVTTMKAEDIDVALHDAKELAKNWGWILKAVEQLDEEARRT